MLIFFFFSSRRRHTRLQGDWSSDVCSSDLASVGQLLAALAHDIKNPLGVIRSSAQLVLDDHQSEAAKREVAQYVIEEVDRLTNRINHFLRFARQKPPEVRPVAVKALLETALQEWRAPGE